MDDLEKLQKVLLDDIAEANDLKLLESVRVATLGKNGHISLMIKTLGQLAQEERKSRGKDLNILRNTVSNAIDSRRHMLEQQALEKQIAAEKIDVTLPPRPEKEGKIHPLSQAMYEIIAIFENMGFTLAEGPNIEDDYHNFTALNIPPEHPARQEHDTFYFPKQKDGNQLLLRTHTSPVQIRTMAKTKPPIRIITPGRTYRSDYDATHTPNFHQVEGLLIDQDINMGHLKGCLIEFCKQFFEVEDLPVRFRPAFFPFTEPSAEMEIGCSRAGNSLKIGAGDDWLEVLGCGMVHPNVLINCNVDPSTNQGFAFGIGVERMAILKYGIPDLRSFYESDLRWLSHYGFAGANALSQDPVL